MNEPGLYNRDDIAPTQTEPQEGTEVFEYTMPDAAETARLLSLLRDRGEPTDKPYTIYQVHGDDPCARLARAVELEVFQDRFPSNDETLMQKEYGEFEDCDFLLAVDNTTGQPVGVMRLLRNSPSGLKSIIDIENPKHEWKKPLTELFAENDLKEADLDDTVDVATIAVVRSHNQTDVAPGLYYALRQYILANEIKTIVTILDDIVLVLLESIGCYFKRYDEVGSKPYLDSPASTPCYISYEEMMQIWQSKSPKNYNKIVLGNDGLLDQVEMVVDRPAEA